MKRQTSLRPKEGGKFHLPVGPSPEVVVLVRAVKPEYEHAMRSVPGKVILSGDTVRLKEYAPFIDPRSPLGQFNEDHNPRIIPDKIHDEAMSHGITFKYDVEWSLWIAKYPVCDGYGVRAFGNTAFIGAGWSCVLDGLIGLVRPQSPPRVVRTP